MPRIVYLRTTAQSGRQSGFGTAQNSAWHPGQNSAGLSQVGRPPGPTSDGARWRINQPLMTVWLDQTPSFYSPSHGPQLKFRLLFKSSPDPDLGNEINESSIFSLGNNWFSPWKAYLKDKGGAGGYFYFNGLGGTINITNGGAADYRSRVTCGTDGSSNPTINYTSGAMDTFGFSDANGRHFLSQRQDAFGNVTSFSWTNDNGVIKLAAITDVDNRSTSFSYATVNGYTLLHQVSDPCSHTVTLDYDLSAGGLPNLTNITDAAGISNSMTYSGSALRTLVTPDGTTTFTKLSSPAGVWVNELGIRDHLYLYIDEGDTSKMTNSYAYLCPSTSPYSNSFDTSDSHLRNSFYWGPRQFGLLASGFVSSLGGGTPDLSQLYATNYLHARMEHWLQSTNAGGQADLGQTLSFERAPSPDGINPGQIEWLDYDNKPPGYITVEGDGILPRFKAWLLPNGQSRFIRYERNSLGNPTSIVETYSDPAGALQLATNLLHYAANNTDLTALTNAAGVCVLSNVFNVFHQVTTNYNALNEATVWTYDGSHRLTSTRTAGGLTTTNLFGSDNYLSQTISLEISATNSYLWTNGYVRSHTDQRSLTLTFLCDGLNHLIKTGFPDSSYITNVFSNLDLIRTVDRMGFTNRWDYNGFGQLLHSYDALGRTNITYQYCACGAPEHSWDALGGQTDYYYDLAGREIQTVGPDGFTVTRNLDLLGRATNTVDSAGTSITNWFNNQGRVYAVSNAAGCALLVKYDNLSRATNSTDGNGVTVVTTFDALNRPVSHVYADSGVESFGYSARGLIWHTNQIGKGTTWCLDAAGRTIFVTNANSEVIAFTNNPAGDLLSLTDGKSQTRRFGVNEFGLTTNKQDQASVEIFRWSYDSDLRLTNRWTRAMGNSSYSWDAINLTNVSYQAYGTAPVSLSYDAANNLTNLVDGIGTTRYTYNSAGQLLTDDGPFDSDTVTNVYANRLRTGLGLQQPTGAWTNGFAFDGIKRLTNVTSQAGSFGYEYSTGAGGSSGFSSALVQRLLFPNTAIETNNWDSNARLLGTYLRTSSGVLTNKHEYQYNQANQRTNTTRTDGSTVGYLYDDISQLTVANASISSESRGYFYDSAWNLNRRTNNGATDVLSVDNKNQLTNALYAVGAQAYDDNGNLISSQDYCPTNSLSTSGYRSFAYDAENRLVQWVHFWSTALSPSNGLRTDFTYDGLGRLRIRQEYHYDCASGGDDSAQHILDLDTGGGGDCSWVLDSETHYIYDGRRVIQERDGSNNPTVSYTRGDDLSGTLEGAGGIGGLLARSDGYSSGNFTSHAFYHADGGGNITMMLNSSQAAAAIYRYDPFANLISKSGSLADANVYRFSSKEIHAASGMYYYLYRFYDPNLQRWINRDPLEEEGGLNLYETVANAPLCYVDPFGLCLPPGDTLDKARARQYDDMQNLLNDLFGTGYPVFLYLQPYNPYPQENLQPNAWSQIRNPETGKLNRQIDYQVPPTNWNPSPLPTNLQIIILNPKPKPK